MTASSFVRWWLLSACAVLTGCSTPQPILNLAGQGAATVGLAEISLREYIALTHSQLEARMDLVRLDAQQDVRDRARRELDIAIDQRIGVAPREDAGDLIRALGNESRQIRERETVELEKIAQTAADKPTLRQVSTEKLAAAKKSFEVLAHELSPTEWLALAAGYAKEIQAGVRKLQASLKESKSGNE